MSKSYRAVLPPLNDADLERLRLWGNRNCAHSALYRDADGACVVWLANKERARSKEASMRSVRGTLKRLAIDVSRLRGRWLLLTTVDAVRAEAGEGRPASAASDSEEPRPPALPRAAETCHMGSPDESHRAQRRTESQERLAPAGAQNVNRQLLRVRQRSQTRLHPRPSQWLRASQGNDDERLFVLSGGQRQPCARAVQVLKEGRSPNLQ